MDKSFWFKTVVILAILIAIIIWPMIFSVRKSEAPTGSTFRGPVGEPYMKGPSGPPPAQ